MPNWISKPKQDAETGRVIDAGTVRCRCGNRHELVLFNDSDCNRCGTEFNSVGQELAPRHQWEECDFD